MDRPSRFLIVKIAALGDVAQCSVLLSRIRAEHPGAHVTWLCGNAAAPMVRLFPVDDVLVVDDAAIFRGGFFQRLAAIVQAWRAVGRRRFDRVLLIHPDWRYRLLTLWVNAARLDRIRHGRDVTQQRFRPHEYAAFLDGADPESPSIRQYRFVDVRDRLPDAPPRSSDRPLVALVPGGSRNVLRDDALRRWPIEKYKALVRRLAADCDVMLLGDARDGELLREHFRDIPHIDRFGTSLIDLLIDLRSADLLVCHDTGPMQFARMVRTRVLGLFGPTNPQMTLGDADDVEWIWGGARLACRPCYDGRGYADCNSNVCLQEISVDAVVARINAQLTRTTVH